MSTPSWATYAGLAAPECVYCCRTPVPQECLCAMLIPVGVDVVPDPFVDYATALDQITNNVLDCVLYQNGDPLSDFTYFTLVQAADFTISASLPPSPTAGSIQPNMSLNLKAGSTLSVEYTVTGTGSSGTGGGALNANIVIDFMNCGTNALIEQFVDSGVGAITGTWTYLVPDDGEYIILIDCIGSADPAGPGASIGTDADLIISSDDTLTVNPVIALWDDSGTTRQLEACPRMVMPAPEWTGTSYADETEAQAAIDAYVIDCLAFSPLDEFNLVDSQSFSGTTYSASNSVSGEPVGFGFVWFSVNLVAGDTVTIECDITGSGPTGCDPGNPLNCSQANVRIDLFDYQGNLILAASDAALGGISKSVSESITVPFTGKYYARALADSGSWDTPAMSGGSGSASVTSTGDISANPIIALYANGTNCPSRLECAP